MYKQILQSIQNVDVWPAISLVIFFLFFVGILIKVALIDKKFIKKMEDMPLDDGTVNNKALTVSQSGTAFYSGETSKNCA